jgi:hypothetical protein
LVAAEIFMGKCVQFRHKSVPCTALGERRVPRRHGRHVLLSLVRFCESAERFSGNAMV